MHCKQWEAALPDSHHTRSETQPQLNTATMQRRGNRDVRFAADDDDDSDYERTFTYRPLSRLPTPPPTLSKASVDQYQSLEGDETLNPRYRGEFFRKCLFYELCSVLSCPALLCPVPSCLGWLHGWGHGKAEYGVIRLQPKACICIAALLGESSFANSSWLQVPPSILSI